MLFRLKLRNKIPQAISTQSCTSLVYSVVIMLKTLNLFVNIVSDQSCKWCKHFNCGGHIFKLFFE